MKDKGDGAGENSSAEPSVYPTNGRFFLPAIVSGGQSDGIELTLSKRPISACNLFTQITVVLVIGLSYFLKLFLIPTKRGFFCGDSSIMYPYRESTIPYMSMLLLANIVVLVVIISTEFMYSEVKISKSGGVQDTEFYQAFGYILHPSAVRCVNFLMISLLGYGTCSFVVFMIKYSLGQLRPNFMDVCRPNMTDGCPEPYIYYETYECTNKLYPDSVQEDAHLSFPSGHTATAFYYATYIMIYAHVRICRQNLVWSSMFFCIYWLAISVASMVGVSRIMDNKHHASDVIFGALIGSVMAASVMYANKHLVLEECVLDSLAEDRTKEITGLDPDAAQSSKN